ncbi:MAG: DNA polymerase III subunit delta [Candidatus Krumholzibacteriota bacterium]|nr:DNA polymerase III subunit delta [Candidatus Krumholzibacteriota bacterium]
MKTNLAYYSKLFKEISGGELTPLYLFKGPEGFIMEELASQIVDASIGEDMRSFNLNIEYASEIDMETFISTACSFPFLADRRILILKEVGKFRGKWKPLLEYCENPSASTVLIIFFNTHDESGRRVAPPKNFPALEKSISRRGRVIQFDNLSDQDLILWIRRKAGKMGMQMDREVSRMLLESVGNNLHDIQNELNKLALLYENRQVTAESLAKVIGKYKLNVMAELLDKIRPGNEYQAVEVLSRIINTGAERPSVVLYQLVHHFLFLLKIKAGGRYGGYRYEQLKRKASLFNAREIFIWLENLRMADILSKNVSFPEEMLIVNSLLHSMNGRLIKNPLESISVT